MKNKNILLMLLVLCSASAFASTGESTFMDIVTEIKSYLGGSFGLMLVLIAFVGAVFAVVGGVAWKSMLGVFALTVALHYGPDILEKIFSADGGLVLGHAPTFNIYDLSIILLGTALALFAFHKNAALKAQQYTTALELAHG